MKTSSQTEAPPLRLLAAASVAELLGVPKSHVGYLRRTDPTFPQAVKLGAAFNAAVRYPEHEVREWMAARMAARAADAARVTARGRQMAERLNASLPPGTRRGGRKARAAQDAPADTAAR